MQKAYEIPELTLIGPADEVVLGMTTVGGDGMGIFAPDFEFEED
jgi:hypothetical protein